MSTMNQILGKPNALPLEFAGKMWDIRLFDMFDAGDFEDFTGVSYWDADWQKNHYQQILLLLILRKSDPDLTPQQRSFRQFKMSLEDVAAMFPVQGFMPAPGSVEFMNEVLKRSGVFPSAEETQTQDQDSDPNGTGATD